MEPEILTKGGLLARGIFALIIGILCFLIPVAMQDVIAYIVGIFLLIISIVSGALCLSAEHSPKHKWGMLILSLIGIVIAILIFISPIWMVVLMTFLIGIWLIVLGITELWLALTLKDAHRILLGVSGFIALIIGILVSVVPFPKAGSMVLIILLGLYLVIFGIISLIAGLLMRKGDIIITI